ncbi:DUF3313 domain-containing protein [Ferrimonas sp. YFM]|uniref:DUF3313 domain-containing protein n=1 Tax=Ferrimonas sp. YFM TaxID=3028878 RepID=UPI002572C5A0|nr:DUF3313 domain-containing protein [Ferrimonas sp. YFM]BDY04122.1 lipoprotein [Ferrimonas sp. YFM]
MLLTTILLGCAATPENNGHALFQGFDDFRPGPPGGVDLVWAGKGINSKETFREKLKKYNKIKLDQVWVVVDENYPLDEEQVAELTEYLTQSLLKGLEGRFTQVEEADAQTLRLSLALTNIETPNPILAVTSTLLPVGLGISTLSKVVTGEHTNVGEGTVELLVRDGATGEPLVAAIDRRQGDKDLNNLVDPMAGIKGAIDWWIERLGRTFRESN